VPGLSAFLAGSFDERREGAGDEADEEPDGLHAVVFECPIDRSGKGDHADHPADAYRQEEEKVLDKIFF